MLMATAVLDLDFKNLPAVVEGLNEYDHAFILLRYGTKPVGKLIVPVINHRLCINEYYLDFIQVAGENLVDCWIEERLTMCHPAAIPSSLTASVVVCTRNRTEDLRSCLSALMKLPYSGQEYIVIDNAPSDLQTRQLVDQFPRVRYVLEEMPGLNVARNRALKEATSEIVLFIDDDAVPDMNWLSAVLKNFSNPMVMCVTGLTLPLELETKAQEAFESFSSFGKGFCKKTFKGGGVIPAGHIGAGVNMALRKKLVEEVGYFDEALDAGTITKSGGDHEYFIRILNNGFHIVYDPDALCWHKHRRTWKELKKTIRGYGTGIYAYWTRLFFIEREFSVGKSAISWFLHNQLPDMFQALLRRSGSRSLKLLFYEWQGCVIGPWAYFISVIQLKMKRRRYG